MSSHDDSVPKPSRPAIEMLRINAHQMKGIITRRGAITGAGAALAVIAAGGRAEASAAELLAPAIAHGSVMIHGKRIAYRTETGETVMRNAAGIPRATIFSVSYLARGYAPQARPVTFIFNGGPGGATWPLREAIAPCIFDKGSSPTGFVFVENPDSLIDVSDLVFIDCPGTGYSRFLSSGAKPEYWGIQQDARAVAQFILGWLRTHRRVNSPKYILGESYGGTRAGQILEMLCLRRTRPISFNGVILVSPAVGSGSQDIFSAVSDARAALVPSEAVAAWYNRCGNYLDKPIEVVASDAQRFAAGKYSEGLRRAPALDRAGKRSLARELSGFIGISSTEILQHNLVMPIAAFRALLLGDRGERLGEDSRIHYAVGAKPSIIDTAAGYDLNAAIIAMVRDNLRYKTDRPYVRDPMEANRMWNNTITTGRKTLPAILKSMTEAYPGFGIFLAGGYFDLTVPYFLPLSALSAAGLPAKRFVHRLYASGHQVLNDVGARPRAVNDVRAFFAPSA